MTKNILSRCEIRTRAASANDVRDLSFAEKKGEIPTRGYDFS